MIRSKSSRRAKIKRRIRRKVLGTAEMPRLCVYRSNKAIYVQLIDDTKGATILAASSQGIDKGTKSEVAKEVGKAIAEKAVANGIESVKFDRNGYLYHGRVKNLAEGAREGGLKF
ncbi:MAG: 50S ribosomal protein L18 [Bacteroidetes bacterium]|jgi:large subunit ribosomal protein L18|nr:50S ribosomal protein L18 [Bacteroidota bacterium]MDA8930494.1 50S ribosomal protein L18 [Bacteroidia bacterium]